MLALFPFFWRFLQGKRRDHTRGYIHYLVRAKKLTGVRLVTLHNLTFIALLMEGIRAAIERGEFEEYAERALRGEEPYGSSPTAIA